jgi:membrane protein DedA with SNARE-associated domain
MTVAITRTMPSGSETVLTMLLGSLAAMATSVVSYWVGSSAGSARKDEHFARIVAGRDASSSVGSSAGS